LENVLFCIFNKKKIRKRIIPAKGILRIFCSINRGWQFRKYRGDEDLSFSFNEKVKLAFLVNLKSIFVYIDFFVKIPNNSILQNLREAIKSKIHHMTVCPMKLESFFLWDCILRYGRSSKVIAQTGSVLILRRREHCWSSWDLKRNTVLSFILKNILP